MEQLKSLCRKNIVRTLYFVTKNRAELCCYEMKPITGPAYYKTINLDLYYILSAAMIIAEKAFLRMTWRKMIHIFFFARLFVHYQTRKLCVVTYI